MTDRTGKKAQLQWGLLLITVLGLAVAASAQTTQPAMPGGRRGAMAPPGGTPLTVPQRQEAISWASENMPMLARLIQRTSPGTPRRNRLVTLAYNRMISERTVPDDTPLKARVGRNIQEEDAVFGMVLEWMNAPLGDRPAIREKIREKVTTVIDGNLREREARINYLRARLAEEEERLTADRARREQMVQNRLRIMMELPAGGPASEPEPGLIPSAEPDVK